MKYQLIACDLDETLLNKDHGICQKNIDLIHKAKAMGVKFVPATGRLFTGVDDVLKMLDLDDQEGEYVISANGGILTENKESRILELCGLTFEKAKELFDFGKKCDVCVQIHALENIYMYNLNEDERNRVNGQGVSYEVLESDNIDCLKDKRIIKVLYETTDVAYLESLEPKLKPLTEGEVSISYSSSRYMELNQLGINKGQGLK
ncbi:MAG: HAD hydrolase family protein, partial [Coprobacillus sp.]